MLPGSRGAALGDGFLLPICFSPPARARSEEGDGCAYRGASSSIAALALGMLLGEHRDGTARLVAKLLSVQLYSLNVCFISAWCGQRSSEQQGAGAGG